MTATVIIAVLTVALIGGVLLLLPRMARPTVPFGVRVPDAYVDAPAVRAATARYHRNVLLAVLAVTGATAVLTLLLPTEVVLTLAPFGLLAAWFPPFLAARRAVQEAKRTEGWFEGVRQTAVADTSLRTAPPSYPWLWAAPAIAIALVTVVVGVAVYPTLPDRIATHFGPAGPDRFADTTPWTALGMVGIQLVLTALLLGLVAITLRGKADLAAAAPAASAEQYRRYMVMMARSVLALAAGMNLTLLLVGLMIWDVVPPTVGWIVAALAPTAIATIALIAIAVRSGQSGHRLRADAAPQPPAATGADRDDDAYWKAGLIYVNRDDPALWVPKRFGGVGWTINFGRPAAWLIAAVIVGGTIGILGWALTQTGDADEPTALTADSTPAEPTTEPVRADLTAIEGTPVGERLEWVLRALAADEPPADADIEEAFDGAIVRQAGAAQLRSVFTQYAGDYDVTALITTTAVTVTADLDDGEGRRWRHVLTVSDDRPDARIAGIYFLPLAEPHTYAGWDEVGRALAGQATDMTFLAAEVDGTTCRPLAEQDSVEQRPVGSAIKLYVLGALADAVDSGTLSWDDDVVVQNHLRSIPAGLLQDAERGTTVTVAAAAELMMALSDNTATDHLIDLLGREAVERALATYGHERPELNRPFLTTRELAQLKWQVDAATRDAYVRGDTTERRAILADLADEPLDVALSDLIAPVAPAEIAWFAAPRDLCTVLARLAQVAERPGFEPVGDALGASTVVRVDRDTWASTAAKGGSEPGVLAFGWLLEHTDGRTFAFITTLLDDGPINQAAVTPVVEGALDLLAGEAR